MVAWANVPLVDVYRGLPPRSAKGAGGWPLRASGGASGTDTIGDDMTEPQQPISHPPMVRAAISWGEAALLRGSVKIPAFGPEGKVPKTPGWQELTASLSPTDPSWRAATGHGVVLTSVPNVLVVDVDDPQLLESKDTLLYKALREYPGLWYPTRKGSHHYYWTEEGDEIPWTKTAEGYEFGRNTPRFIAGPGSENKEIWPEDPTTTQLPPGVLWNRVKNPRTPAAEKAAKKERAEAEAGHGGARPGAGRKPKHIAGYKPGTKLGTGKRHETLLEVAAGLRGSAFYGQSAPAAVKYLMEKVIPNCEGDHNYDLKWVEDLVERTWEKYPPPVRKPPKNRAIDFNELIRSMGKWRPGGRRPRIHNGEILTYRKGRGVWTADGDGRRTERAVLRAVAKDELGRATSTIGKNYSDYLVRQGKGFPPSTGWTGLREGDFHPDRGMVPTGAPSRYIRMRFPGNYDEAAEGGELEAMLGAMFAPEDEEFLWAVMGGGDTGGARLSGSPLHHGEARHRKKHPGGGARGDSGEVERHPPRRSGAGLRGEVRQVGAGGGGAQHRHGGGRQARPVRKNPSRAGEHPEGGAYQRPVRLRAEI